MCSGLLALQGDGKEPGLYPPPSPVLLANQVTEERGLCRAPQGPAKADVPITFCLSWNGCVNSGQENRVERPSWECMKPNQAVALTPDSDPWSSAFMFSHLWTQILKSWDIYSLSFFPPCLICLASHLWIKCLSLINMLSFLVELTEACKWLCGCSVQLHDDVTMILSCSKAVQ